MMSNPKIPPSSKKHLKKHGSPRSPLKLRNLNSITSSSSSSSSSLSSCTTSTSISSDVPTGCLRFFHSSTAFKHAASDHKSPKSAPNVRKFRSNVVKKQCHLPNPSFTQRLRSKKSDFGEKFGERFGFYNGGIKAKSGVQSEFSNESANVVKVRKPGSRCDLSDGISKKSSRLQLKFSGDCDKNASLRKHSSRCDLSDRISKFPAVDNLGNGSDLDSRILDNKDVKLMENGGDCGDVSRSPTPPPVQASVSPEIQGGLTSVVAATPSTCYAAGYVLSGVTDKRKCRPKGILTIGNNNLFGSSKSKGVQYESENRRDSILPSPTEASVCWLSSPYDEKRSETRDDGVVAVDDDNTNELSISRCEKLYHFELAGCSSSPSSSLGFSSEMLNKSNCTISTSDASSTTPSSRSKSFALHSDLSSEYRGMLGPSLDQFVCCPSPLVKVDFSPEKGKFQFHHERQPSPDLKVSLGSGNVMQTPDSNSRSPKYGISEISRDQISKLWFESEVDSMTEVLRRVSVSPNCQVVSPTPSFEFNPLTKLDSSIDLNLSRETIDIGPSDKSLLLPYSSTEPEVEISCRENLVSFVSEVDELDCCRYLSDEEDDANESIVTPESYGPKTHSSS